MATVVDLSGNSAVGVVPHIPSKTDQSNEAVVTAVEEVKTVLDSHTTILEQIETNTAPA